MSPLLKIATGLAATVLSAWLFHGPAGYGQRVIDGMNAQVQPVVARQELKTVAAGFTRRPLSRDLRFSGEANSFQRQRFIEIIQDKEIRGLRSIGWDRASPSIEGEAR